VINICSYLHTER